MQFDDPYKYMMSGYYGIELLDEYIEVTKFVSVVVSVFLIVVIGKVVSVFLIVVIGIVVSVSFIVVIVISVVIDVNQIYISIIIIFASTEISLSLIDVVCLSFSFFDLVVLLLYCS